MSSRKPVKISRTAPSATGPEAVPPSNAAYGVKACGDCVKGSPSQCKECRNPHVVPININKFLYSELNIPRTCKATYLCYLFGRWSAITN